MVRGKRCLKWDDHECAFFLTKILCCSLASQITRSSSPLMAPTLGRSSRASMIETTLLGEWCIPPAIIKPMHPSSSMLPNWSEDNITPKQKSMALACAEANSHDRHVLSVLWIHILAWVKGHRRVLHADLQLMWRYCFRRLLPWVSKSTITLRYRRWLKLRMAPLHWQPRMAGWDLKTLMQLFSHASQYYIAWCAYTRLISQHD